MDSNQLFVYIWQRSQSDQLDIANKVKPDQIVAIVDALKPRSANLNELYDGASFLWADRPIKLDEKAQEKIVDAYVKDLWSLLLDVEWDQHGLESVVHRYLEAHPDMKLVEVATSLRAALTGKTVSPPIYDVMLALGRDETLARLKDRFYTEGDAIV
jgi:glutamyl-tRNA synthetase